MVGRAGRAAWGAIRRQKSGRLSASYVGPDGRRHFAPLTFTTRTDAGAWLARERAAIAAGTWVPPSERDRRTPDATTVRELYASWLTDRDRPLAPTTEALYAKHWRSHIEPTFGALALPDVTPEKVRTWHRTLKTGPTARAHALGMLRAMLNYAVRAELLTVNPAAGVGATKGKRVRDLRPATPREVAVIVEHMRTSQGGMLVLMASWLALRWGEVTELRRRDIDLEHGVVRVERAVSRVGGRWLVSTPKAESVRSVAIPPHLRPLLAEFVADLDDDELLFPARRNRAGHLSADTFRGEFDAACAAAGRPDLTPHSLRHSGAVWAAQSGATLVDVMARLGHTSTAAALRYQHSAEARQADIAARMSALAE